MAEKKRLTRAKKVEVDERVRFIKSLLLGGHTVSEIKQISAQKWGYKDRQIHTLINRANEQIEEINRDGTKKLLAKIVGNQWRLFRKSLNEGRIDLARTLLMDIAKLRGLQYEQIVIEERPLEELKEDDLAAMEENILMEDSYVEH